MQILIGVANFVGRKIKTAVTALFGQWGWFSSTGGRPETWEEMESTGSDPQTWNDLT